ncbi:MAG: 3-phosphoshikimate 1-carboxyvinyltransferase [Pyrinomonadaceae bacterium]
MKIKPADKISGQINLPGDKSISHRAAIFSAMADGVSKIENFSTAADCASTLECLENLGVVINRENTTVFIKGVGKNSFQKPEKDLDCGNSGTTVRLLSGVLAGQSFDSVLTGDESLSIRPMKRVITPLEKMGAIIESENNCLPMKIHGKNPLKSIAYEMPVASAQVKSCVLLAGLNADGVTRVRSPKTENKSPSSRNHTELMLKNLGAEIGEEFIFSGKEFIHQVAVSGEAVLMAKDFRVPSDISSAAFFAVAAACLKNSELVIKNVGMNPTRTAFLDVLKRFGGKFEILNEQENGGEIIGDLRVFGKTESNFTSNLIGGEIIANLIDEVPILAVFGTQISGGLEIRNAEELRVKESDRITAVVENLKRMNAAVEEFPDGLRVGKSDLKCAKLESFGDHRIAMAFSIAALFADGETEINGAESANVSFPEFFKVLAQIVK